MLISSPIVILICAYVATIYGFLYLMFTTIPTVFGEAYGWPTSLAGLAYTPCECQAQPPVPDAQFSEPVY